jgi:DNA-binding transcriptional LysR family regulator
MGNNAPARRASPSPAAPSASTSPTTTSLSTQTASTTTAAPTSTSTAATSLGRLAVFAAVAESKSFSLAAQRLGLPRSSVSKHVAALEATVQAPLFFRTTRKVALSPAGEALYARVAPGLAQLQGALAAPVVDDEDRGLIRITAIADFTAAVLKDLIAAFVLRFPAVRIELLLTERLVDLKGDGVDLAFRFSFGSLRGGDLYGKKLGDVHLSLYASPAYLARAGVPRSFADLRRHQSVGTPLRFPLKNGAARQFLKQAPTVTCDDMNVCRALIAAGVGVGILPGHLVRDDVQRGLLVPVLPEWQAMRGTAWIVTPQKKPPLRVQRFRDFAIAQASDWFR